MIYGDIGRNRAHIQAGTQGDNGGIRAGDKINGRTAPSANRLPMLVGDFQLVDHENAVVFAPTVWVANDEVGHNAPYYRQRFQTRTRYAAYDVRDFIEKNSAQFHWSYSLSNRRDDWFEMLFSAVPGVRQDRPIGSARAFSGSEIFEFFPHTFLLTYKSVTDFMKSAGGRREVIFDAQYLEANGANYTMMMTIERVK